MRGNLREARGLLDQLTTSGVNERWVHVYFPLFADVLADQGQLASVKEVAQKYLSLEVHPTGEAAKLGVLNPLVRAEVDAALQGVSAENAAAAKETLERMHQIVEENPPLTAGSTSMMTPYQNVAFAEAEVSRLTSSDPALWANAGEMADYAYYRIYALWRQAEALLRRGERPGRLLEEVHDQVAAMGAQLMRTRVKRTAAETQG